ncbi:MAG: hypothetical protein SFU56_11380 [Capsulimonadales bacterium]|nr:hypothetical protein [Capsulimonadales bacterium]
MKTAKQLAPHTVIITLTLAAVVIGVVEVKVLEAREQAENPPQVIDTAYCVRCHSTPEDLARLRRKEGNSGFLFNADGSLRDAEVVDWYRKNGSSHTAKYGTSVTYFKKKP